MFMYCIIEASFSIDLLLHSAMIASRGLFQFSFTYLSMFYGQRYSLLYKRFYVVLKKVCTLVMLDDFFCRSVEFSCLVV